jgi:hypothetical protein
MATPYLAIPHIAQSQNSKEVTAKDAFDRLDASVNAQVEIALTDADVTLTQPQIASGGVLKFTGALTADRYINVPAVDRAFVVRNSTSGGFNLIVQVVGAAGASVSVAPATLASLYCDSIDVIAVGGGGGGAGGGGGTGGLTAYDITPTGTINGTDGTDGNPTFTFPNAPNPPGSLQFFKNGRKMMQGIDGTLSGAVWTYASGSIPVTGDVHIAGLYTY